MKKVWAMYFSPTGGTKKVTERTASALAKSLDLPLAVLDFTLPQTRKTVQAFSAEDIVVFGTPVIAGRVPNVLLPYLREQVQGNGALAVPLVSFGNRNYDDALIELRNILEQDGFHTIAAAAFVSEHSFSRTLAAGRPDAADLALAEQFAERIAAKRAAWTSPVPVKGNDPIRPYFQPQDRFGKHIDIRKVKPQVSDACINCGHCADVCPMGSISHENVREYIGICIKCCACEKKCPVGARYFDDPGYLYHKTELEELYARRAEPEFFL